MRRVLLLATLCSLAIISPAAPDDPPGSVPAPKPKPTHTNCHYRGVVTRITPSGITITGMGDRPDGPEVRGERTFAPTATLRAGGYELRKVYDVFTYRWADVQVGDRVEILFDVVGGADVCACIAISGRPGGRVPPAPGQLARRAQTRRHNEGSNTRPASEEKSISIPGKIPLPAVAATQEQRIAPMPRLVTPKAPPPKP